MLENLTPEQTALIPVIRQRWIDKLNKPKQLDREKCTPLIHRLYKTANIKEPMIIYVDSPLYCQIGANLLKGS